MKPARSILNTIADSGWLRDAGRRRAGVAVAGGLLALLCYFPRSYVAEVELSPQAAAGGLSAMLSGGSNGVAVSMGSILAQRQSVDGEVEISRSHAVVQDVIRRLHLVERKRFRDEAQAEVELNRRVDLEGVRGTVVQIRVEGSDPAFTGELAAGYADAIRERLAALRLSQASAKRATALSRVNEAQLNLARDQTALNAFRAANKLAEPEAQLGAAVVQLSALQARLQAKQVQLSTLLTIATEENVAVRAVRAEIAGLQAAIAQAQQVSGGATAETLAAMSQRESTYLNLVRNERFRRVLLEIYDRYLESLETDDLAARSNVVMVEPVYIDPERRRNVWAEGLLLALAVVASAAEFYIVRPPRGSMGQTRASGVAA